MFSKIIKIDENRAVQVSELPHGTVAIHGIKIYSEGGPPTIHGISFSKEATEALTNMLIEYRETKNA